MKSHFSHSCDSMDTDIMGYGASLLSAPLSYSICYLEQKIALDLGLKSQATLPVQLYGTMY